MKRMVYVFLLAVFSMFLRAEPVNAEMNNEMYEKDKTLYDSKLKNYVEDDNGLGYLVYDDTCTAWLISTPDAKSENDILNIAESFEHEGVIYNITGVGLKDGELWETLHTLFTFAKGYKKVIFGKNVKRIEGSAFAENETLEEIEFLGDAIELDSGAFKYCKKLKAVLGSEKIIKIGACAFEDTSITSFTLSPDCKKIGASAFEYCKKLKEIPDISKVEKFGHSVFQCCTGLKKVVIPNGVEVISEGMFEECTNIRELYISESVRKIKDDAFSGCRKLRKNVTISPKNKYFTAKDGFILNKKGDTILLAVAPSWVMVIPSYVKKVKDNFCPYEDVYSKDEEDFIRVPQTVIVQNPKIRFDEDYNPELDFRMLYPKGYKKANKKNTYTLYSAPQKVKTKVKKGKVQVSFNKIKNNKVKKYQITYRVKKANGIYDAQKTKVVKGKKATLCTLKKGEVCEVRVATYTRQKEVWVPGKYSRMRKVKR